MKPLAHPGTAATNYLKCRSVLSCSLLLLALTATSVATKAQSFSQPIARDVGPNPNSGAAGDFNGDGITDLAVGLTTGGVVRIMLGQGDGSFSSLLSHLTDQNPEGTAAGDFNKDGKLDVAVGNFYGGAAGTGNISVLLGKGDGQLHPAVNYAADSPHGLTAADLNSDGNLDLVTASWVTNKVTVLLGRGDGTFRPATAYPVGTEPRAAVAADFNNDGKLDLAVASAIGGDINILKGVGDGTFQAAVSLPIPPRGLTDVVAGDLNADGNQDLVVMAGYTRTLIVMPGVGDGTFQTPISYPLARSSFSPEIADFNGDGKPDVAVAEYEGAVSVRRGNGDGTLQPPNNHPTLRTAYALVVSDFNSDGKPDLAVMNQGLGRVNLLLNSPSLRCSSINATSSKPADNIAVASFIDYNSAKTAASFTATVDWGDGTAPAPATVSARTGGGFNVTGSHIYAQAGSYDFNVRLADAAGNFATATCTATVADAPLTASPKVITALRGGAFTAVVADFADDHTARQAGEFSAEINWGDGATSQGDITGGGGAFSVSGEHTYGIAGTFPVRVSIRHVGGDTAAAGSTADVTSLTISGRILRADGTPIAGVVVALSGSESATATTGANGGYSYQVLPNGSYTVTPSKRHYTFSPQAAAVNVAGASQTVDITAALNTHAISGRAVNAANNAPLAGVIVTLSGALSATAQTDAQGRYSFASLPAGGSYAVTAGLTHYTFSPASRVFTDLGADQAADFAATLNAHAISGRIFRAGDIPLPGVSVTLSGARTGTAQTNAQGNYSFQNLPAGGTYTVTPSLADYTFTPPSRTFSDLGGNQTTGFTAASVPASIQFSASGYTTGEGGAAATVTVTRAVNTSTAVGVSYSTANGTAAAGSDYTPVFGTLNFAPGETAKAITVPILDDVAVEGSETFAITLSAPTGAALLGSPISATVTVTENDSCSFAVSSQVPSEFPAEGGYGSFQMVAPQGCAWRVNSLAPWITITWGVSGSGTGTVSFSVAANIGAARTGQILRTDDSFINVRQAAAAASLRLESFAVSVSEGAGRAEVKVMRAGDTSGASSVTFQTVDDAAAVPCATIGGRAYARCDYATTIETLSWAAGDAQPKTVTVPLIDDGRAEGAEAIQIRLSSPQGAVVGAVGAATLTIVDNDAVEGANPIAGSSFFVRQQYLDFLSREPEPGEPWTGVLARCPDVNNTDPASLAAGCDRLLVSQSFFQSPEFSLKGFYSYLFYRIAFGRRPEYSEITLDMRSLAGATPQEVFDKRAAYAASFAERPEFAALYGGMTNRQLVETLLGRHGLGRIETEDPKAFEGAAQVVLTAQQLIDALDGNALSRAQVLRAIVQSNEVDAAEYHGAFVSMQYYGYLRRTPEQSGYDAWLRVIKQDPSNIRQMVHGFLNSTEYRLRFGQP